MVNSLLFRWEDTQALQHHCGVCERPLAHPSARTSCFGTHTEPCHRFHQAMFMRLRAHICAYCHTIDEAHYKRHHGLVEHIRGIYESCGEVDWTIVPAEPGDPRRGQSITSLFSYSEPDDRTQASGETPTSKRDRKDAKSLARAAGRPRVVTQEEIRYVDSILHAAEGVSSSDNTSPANIEEMQLIETHLRYNAHVYNSHSSRSALRKFAKIPSVDVDFDAEMDRILDTFRVDELVKRNLKNRGLRGKELKSFEGRVEAFRTAVVEDLVLVKKDSMEIRMRRAGYLRYTNKTAYNIVEERYTDTDWKTGERIHSVSSSSSGVTSQSEDMIAPPSEVHKPVAWPDFIPVQDPDRRHLQHFHTRISGDDGLGQRVIEPYRAPLLPMIPNTTAKKPVVLQLTEVENKENSISAGQTSQGWRRRGITRHAGLTQSVYPDGKTSLSQSSRGMPSTCAAPLIPGASVRPALCKLTSTSTTESDIHKYPAPDLTANTARTSTTAYDALPVQAPNSEAVLSLEGPECALTISNDVDCTHPVVSQKKAKKARREATRKAKKANDVEQVSTRAAEDNTYCDAVEQTPIQLLSDEPTINEITSGKDQLRPQTKTTVNGVAVANEEGVSDNVESVAPSKQATISIGDSISSLPLVPPLLPCTTHGKHDQWMKFTRIFVVDQLTAPLLQSDEGCSHGSSCLFESKGVRDCPFHAPHCLCSDPLRNQCFLIYPGEHMSLSGPYNRAHGERLMFTYEQYERTKGRLILIDSDVATYFVDCIVNPDNAKLANMPARLFQEHTQFQDTDGLGPLMKQEVEFGRLFIINSAMRHPLTKQILEDIERPPLRKDPTEICYCRIEVDDMSRAVIAYNRCFVQCSYAKCSFGGLFHKRCVKKLGVERVSRWYCTACETEMKKVAYKALNIPMPMPCLDKDTITDRAEKIAETIGKPGGSMDRFKSRIQKLGEQCGH